MATKKPAKKAAKKVPAKKAAKRAPKAAPVESTGADNPEQWQALRDAGSVEVMEGDQGATE